MFFFLIFISILVPRCRGTRSVALHSSATLLFRSFSLLVCIHKCLFSVTLSFYASRQFLHNALRCFQHWLWNGGLFSSFLIVKESALPFHNEEIQMNVDLIFTKCPILVHWKHLLGVFLKHCCICIYWNCKLLHELHLHEYLSSKCTKGDICMWGIFIFNGTDCTKDFSMSSTAVH